MQLRTETRPGWVELTHAGVHVLAKGDDHLRDRLTAAIAAAGGDALPDVLTDELASGGVRQAPDFVIVDEPGRRVLVRGSARVVLTADDGSVREVVAPVRAPWVDEDLDEGAASAVLATGEPEPVPDAAQEHAAPPRTPESLVPAPASSQPVPSGEGSRPQFVDGHLISRAVEVAAPVAAAGGPSPTDSPAGPVASGPGSGPMTGVLPTAPGAVDPVPPARLALPTGEVVTLDRGVVLGRAPRASAAIGAAQDPHLVRVASPDNEISRSHVEIYPDGGQVVVRDLGSTNGTTLTPPGGDARRVDPGAPHPITGGTTIRLAGQVAVVLGED